MDKSSETELAGLYARRFERVEHYRRRVWQVLVAQFFQKLVAPTAKVLDLGCGYGEFINALQAGAKFGMDMNSSASEHLGSEVRFIHQDCSTRWPFSDGELDVVFTSNFFEHLPDKKTLGRTLDESFRCLKRGGRLIAVGPNIHFTGGRYWDFWDHYLPLTEASLCEGLIVRGFQVERCHDRFLPYTMVGRAQYPLWLISLYVRLPLLWRFFGEQFLIVAGKAST